MGTPESTIELCPDVILDDVGDSFVLGTAGGSAFHFIRGIYNSPTGARLSGGLENVRMNAPKVGGIFAVWGGLISTFDCAIVYARQKEDAWNSIFAGAATGGLSTLRQGFRASRSTALFSGTLLTLLEGTMTAVDKFASAEQNEEEEACMGDVPETFSASEAGSGSWVGSLFGSGKRESEVKSVSTTQILESFDAPHVPPYDSN